MSSTTVTTDKVILELEVPLFDLERNYKHFDWNAWTVKNRHLSIIFGAIYLVLVFFGRRYMRNREPYSLRGPLALWNFIAAVFSISVLIRVAPYFLKRTFFIPFYYQMCETEYDTSQVTMFWLDWFVLTKPVEFIDTFFIVVRKQHLHFLHYYHHVTVVILCWYSLGIAPVPPNSIYYVAMNSFVHSFMYTYYLSRAIRIPVPRCLQMTITIFQIIQMIIGSIINVSPLIFRLRGRKCDDAAFESIYLGLAIYFSYLLLFANFFYQTYFSAEKKKQDKKE